MPHLLLQLKDTIHKCLTSRWTTRHIDINRHNPITPSSNTITIMIIATTISTRSHTNNPSRIGHLIVDLSKCRCHLVGEGSGYNHDVGLTRRRSENYTKSILIVAGGGEVHHFDGTAGESEGHGPKGSLTRPVGNLIEGGSVDLVLVFVYDISIPYRHPNTMGTSSSKGKPLVLIPLPPRPHAFPCPSHPSPSPILSPEQKKNPQTYKAYCITPFLPS